MKKLGREWRGMCIVETLEMLRIYKKCYCIKSVPSDINQQDDLSCQGTQLKLNNRNTGRYSILNCPEVGIYKRKQESKKRRKHAFDQ